MLRTSNGVTDELMIETPVEWGVPAEEVLAGRSLAFLCSRRPLVIADALTDEGAGVGDGLGTTITGDGTAAPFSGAEDSAPVS